MLQQPPEESQHGSNAAFATAGKRKRVEVNAASATDRDVMGPRL
jgi:hypothetical protein